MKPLENKQGIIAILDALGASLFSKVEIRRFLRSRNIVLNLLEQKSESMSKRLDTEKISTFTFNDTIIVVLESAYDETTEDEIEAFLFVLRKFIVDSLWIPLRIEYFLEAPFPLESSIRMIRQIL